MPIEFDIDYSSDLGSFTIIGVTILKKQTLLIRILEQA
jgi:hypothetical protein